MVKDVINRVQSEYNALCHQYTEFLSEHQLSPYEIADVAREIYWKEQIKNYIKYEGEEALTDSECDVLLKTDNILDSIYENFYQDASVQMLNATRAVIDEAKYKLMPDKLYEVELGVEGFVYEDSIGKTGDLSPDSRISVASDEYYTNLAKYNHIEDTTDLYYVAGRVIKNIVAKSADEAYGLGMAAVDFGDMVKPRISGGGVDEKTDISKTAPKRQTDEMER